MRLTTLSAFGLEHIHPGTHRVRKAFALLLLLRGQIAVDSSRPDLPWVPIWVPIEYKAHVRFCSHEGRKLGHVRVTTLSAFGLDHIQPGTHRAPKTIRTFVLTPFFIKKSQGDD